MAMEAVTVDPYIQDEDLIDNYFPDTGSSDVEAKISEAVDIVPA